MSLRFRVAELRRAKGWTQQMLAEEAGVSRATIIRLEDADEPPLRIDMAVLEKLAEAFAVEPGFLIARTLRGRAD